MNKISSQLLRPDLPEATHPISSDVNDSLAGSHRKALSRMGRTCSCSEAQASYARLGQRGAALAGLHPVIWAPANTQQLASGSPGSCAPEVAGA